MITCLDGWKKVQEQPHELQGHVKFLATTGADLRVIEFGFQVGKSALAFLEGGCRSVHSYDVSPCEPYVKHLRARFPERFAFTQADTTTMPVIAPCDVLFIDSSHKKEPTWTELVLHHESVADCILMHDTEKFRGELDPVIAKFTDQYGWHIATHFKHSYGLTVLRRKE